MKQQQVHFIIEGILTIAVIVLFVLFFTGKTNTATPISLSTGDNSQISGAMAYVNVDSLLTNYTLAKDMNEKLLRKEEDNRATLNQKARQLQSEVGEFERKMQNNAFLSQERAQQEQQRLMRKQQELQELGQSLSTNLMAEQQKMNMQLRDSVNAFLKSYNATRNYTVIFSNTMSDNILTAAPELDITKEIIEGMNSRCK